MKLWEFVPYRLALLAETVSRTVAQIYADRFGLSRPEWRVLAALGELGAIAAKDVAPHSALDKMAVSRAVAGLEARGCLTREDDPADRRNRILHLTPRGRALYEKIVPLALARETYLLAALTDEERETFRRILAKLQARAEALESRG
jgi:DNA-binding MarR family transcriptional regulator